MSLFHPTRDITVNLFIEELHYFIYGLSVGVVSAKAYMGTRKRDSIKNSVGVNADQTVGLLFERDLFRASSIVSAILEKLQSYW